MIIIILTLLVEVCLYAVLQLVINSNAEVLDVAQKNQLFALTEQTRLENKNLKTVQSYSVYIALIIVVVVFLMMG